MAGLFETLFSGDGTHPKDVAKAYYDLNRQLAMDEGSEEQRQWKELFDKNKISANRFRPNSDKNERLLEGISPGQTIANADEKGNVAPIFLGSSVQPPPMSELERWKRQVDGLIESGNPVLQKEGLSMIAQYRQQANASSTDQRSTKMREYELARSQGYRGSWMDYLKEQPSGVNINMGPKDKFIAHGDLVYDESGQPVDVPIGMTYDEGRSRGYKFRQPASTADESRVAANQDALKIIDNLQSKLFDPEAGIYNDPVWQNKGVVGVAGGMATGAWQQLTQNDPRYKGYSNMRRGVAAPIVRTFGEKGALSNADIERALNLIPNVNGLDGLVDLPETAQIKFDFLRSLVTMSDPTNTAAQLLLITEAEEKLDQLKRGDKLPPRNQSNSGLPPPPAGYGE